MYIKQQTGYLRHEQAVEIGATKNLLYIYYD